MGRASYPHPHLVEQRRAIRCRDVALDVRIFGSGPAFVWSHALLSSIRHELGSGLFDWSELAHHHTIVRYDARGHGSSAGSFASGDYEWPSLASDLLCIATGAGHDRFAAGGAGSGAGVALWSAVEARDRVTGLVLVAPPASGRDRDLRRRLELRLGAVLGDLRLSRSVARGARLVPGGSHPYGTGAAWSATKPRILGELHPDVLAAALRGELHNDLPPPELLARIDCPVLVLAWTGDGRHPVAAAERITSQLSRGELIVSDGDVSGWPGQVGSFLAGLED